MADLDKQKITLVVATSVLVGLLGIAWRTSSWCTDTSNQLKSLSDAVTLMSTDKYTAKDAARDTRDRDKEDSELQRQIDKLNAAVTALQLTTDKRSAP